MWICKHCNNEFGFGITDRNSKANHSRWCDKNPKATHYRETNGKNNRSWNKGLTKDTDTRVAAITVKSKNFTQIHGGSFLGKTHSTDAKIAISKSMMGNRNANHRGDRQSYYNNIRMDSRWEVGTARYLDNISSMWRYNEKSYRLSDGRYYYPDFFVYENDLLVKVIEVKGYFRESNRQKYNMFLSEYPNVPIELWQRDKLFELGIIDASGYVLG